MATFRKIHANLWCDPAFAALDADGKLRVLEDIAHNRVPPEFERYAGPRFRVAGKVKNRPDLYTAAWRKTRARILREQGTICFYCKADCSADPTVDHVNPVCKGGDPNEQTALVVSCRPCNSSKGGKEGWK